MEFTIKTYKALLNALIEQGFSFQTFQEYIENYKGLVSPCLPDRQALGDKGAGVGNKTIILRHDVDKLPGNSFRFAQIQHELGIKGTYFFRIVPESFNPEIIEKIAGLGHEIGYHYEDVDLASKNIKNQLTSNKKHVTEKNLAEQAIQLFDKHLKELRKFAPIKTICMHGSPLSKYDNKLLWKYYNYRDYGIIGEPYFDVDFTKVLYLTDTGRRWNGEKVSVRDKVAKSSQQSIVDSRQFKNTHEIISAANKGTLSGFTERSRSEIMFTFHPQRWTDKPLPWVKELVLQNVKNVVKYFLNKVR